MKLFMTDLRESKVMLETMLPHEESLKDLGILDKVKDLLTKAGLGVIFHRNAPSFPAVLYEFVASFESGGLDAKNRIWNCSIGGKYCTLDRKEVCGNLGFPMEGKVPDCSEYARYLFWKEISGLDMFFVPNLYSSHIKEGIWKVIHRFVAQVINQRGEGARFISGDDIDIMIYIQRESNKKHHKAFEQERATAAAFREWTSNALASFFTQFGFDDFPTPPPATFVPSSPPVDPGPSRRKSSPNIYDSDSNTETE
ncbi:hypothetical protein QQ045_005799 [Rhodiola kirilowii]